MKSPKLKRTQKEDGKAGRLYCICAANVFSAASVGTAYFGATQNASALVLALGFAAAATLLFRYRRQGPILKEPLWLRALLPTMYAVCLAWELMEITGAGAGNAISPLGWMWTGLLLLLVGLDLWFNRPIKTIRKT